MNKKFLLFIFLFCSSLTVLAQDILVSGKVISSDDGFGLPGVTVTVKGSSTGTVTDIDGNYTIEANRMYFTFEGERTLDVSQLPVGVYLVKMLAGQVITKKVVINR